MLSVRWSLIGAVLVGLLAWPVGAVGWLSHDPGAAQGAAVVINEVQYDPPAPGSELAYEWVELLNTGPEAVSLDGWQVADARSANPLPAVTVAPGEYLVVAAGGGFAELFPGFTGRVVVLGGRIGNGLGNSGDQVRLLAADGVLVDGLSYGDDAGLLDPPAPDVAAGHSLERVPAGADTDTAADWADQPAPSPGQAGGATVPTAVPPTAPPPTLPPGVRPVLNEYLPAPKLVDWDGDGQATAEDEWIEVFNAGGVAVDLRGWQLDDAADGGSSPFVFPEGVVLAPRGWLVVFGSQSKLQLNNGADSVRLLAPDGTVVDETAYTKSAPDAAYARLGDGDGPWTDVLPPSPGQANPAAGVPTPTAGPATRTPTSPGPGRTPTGVATGVATGAATVPPPGGTPAPAYLPLLISEVLPDPLVAGDDAAEEWVEVFNRGAGPVSLAGWSVGDGTRWDELPDAWLPARGFAVVVGGTRAVGPEVAAAAVVVTVADGRIGNGLGNTGDVVRLRGPTGEVADAVSYGASLAAFDPAVPLGPPGSSLERLPPDHDTDTAEDWWTQPAPSPGRAGQRHADPPRVVINEVLPAPAAVDWGGDGVADHTDEWVELYNAAPFAVVLDRWHLEVGEPAVWTYRFPPNRRLAAGGFLVVHRAESGLALVNGGDQLRLRRDDGVVADSASWSARPGYDRSIGRLPDGDGPWVAGLEPSPGAANRRRRTEVPPVSRAGGEPIPETVETVALTAVRGLPPGSRVRVRGWLTAAPGTFGSRTAYVGDAAAGLMVYLGPRGSLPELAVGTGVSAVGRLRDYHGERELVLERATDLWADADLPATALAPPASLATGALGEAVEGRLVVVTGRLVTWRRTRWIVDDGSGPAAIAFRAGWRAPAAATGTWWRVVGVVGQSAARSPWTGGYRLQPRGRADVGPRGAARTGRAQPVVRVASGPATATVGRAGHGRWGRPD